MKALTLFLALSLMCTVFASAQKGPAGHDLTIYTYKTYEDYLADKSENVGAFKGYMTGTFKGMTITLEGGKEIKDKEIWGFKMDQYLFRWNDRHLPSMVLGTKEKVFYLLGSFMLQIMKHGPEYGTEFTLNDCVYYSDNLNTPVLEIKKLKSEQKDNPVFKPLIDCLKLAKKQKTLSGELNESISCIKAFTK